MRAFFWASVLSIRLGAFCVPPRLHHRGVGEIRPGGGFISPRVCSAVRVRIRGGCACWPSWADRRRVVVGASPVLADSLELSIWSSVLSTLIRPVRVEIGRLVGAPSHCLSRGINENGDCPPWVSLRLARLSRGGGGWRVRSFRIDACGARDGSARIRVLRHPVYGHCVRCSGVCSSAMG